MPDNRVDGERTGKGGSGGTPTANSFRCFMRGMLIIKGRHRENNSRLGESHGVHDVESSVYFPS